MAGTCCGALDLRYISLPVFICENARRTRGYLPSNWGRVAWRATWYQPPLSYCSIDGFLFSNVVCSDRQCDWGGHDVCVVYLNLATVYRISKLFEPKCIRVNGDIVDGRNDILRITTKLLLTITPASTPKQRSSESTHKRKSMIDNV